MRIGANQVKQMGATSQSRAPGHMRRIWDDPAVPEHYMWDQLKKMPPSIPHLPLARTKEALDRRVSDRTTILNSLFA